MSEEENKVIRIQFHNILNNIINNKIAPTGTAILNAEQPMILLFEELINKIEKQQKEISRLQNIKRKDIQDLIDNEKVNIYKNYISKDKIREKIKELEKFIESPRTLPFEIIQEQNCNARYKIEALKELLEEE